MYHKINSFTFKKLIPIALIFLVAHQVHAEKLPARYAVASQANETITGNVSDQDGSAIEGAKVTVVETGETVTTHAFGNFTVSAGIGQTLSVSYDGYTAQMVKISGPTVSISLKSKKMQLPLKK